MTGYQRSGKDLEVIRSHIKPGLSIKEGGVGKDNIVPFVQKSLRSGVDIYKHGGSVTGVGLERKFRVGFDNRREMTTYSPVDGLLASVPHKNRNVATTYQWVSKLGANKYASRTGYVPTGGSKDYRDMMIRMFIRAVTQDKLNGKSLSYKGYKGLAAIIKDLFDKSVSPQYIAVQKGRPFIPNCVPRSVETKIMLDIIKDKLPLFRADELMGK